MVWGEGPSSAEFMIIGEAPGAREDWAGRSFVGDSGIRLNVLLRLLGLDRDEVYVTNVVKHRPPRNRTPKASEVHSCKPYLVQEILTVQPQVIICMGGTAIKAIIGALSVTQNHGYPRRVSLSYIQQVNQALDRAAVGKGPVKSTAMGQYSVVAVPMYHPAYTLRNPDLWPVLAEDFLRLRGRLSQVDTAPESGQYIFTTAQRRIPPFSRIGFDLETTSPHRAGRFMVHEADIVGYSTASTPFRASYFPGDPRREPLGTRMGLEDDRVQVICHNTKFEYSQLRRIGVNLTSFEDTKLAAYLLGYGSTHLKHLTQQLLGESPITYSEATGGRDMGDIDPREVAEYGAADSDHTLRLWDILEPELKSWGLWKLYTDIERPLIPVLAGMELRGIQLDRAAAARAVQYFQELAVVAAKAAVAAGFPEHLNLMSRDQLATWLEAQGAPITDRTESKQQLKTDSATMTKLKTSGWMPEFVQAYLDFIEKKKLASFPALWLTLADSEGVLHPNFNQAGHYEEQVDDAGSAPITGRLSCTSPNIMQIPHHGRGKPAEYEEFGKILRRCFVARPGFSFIALDIAQQEPRITAVVANEPVLLDTFARGEPAYALMGEILYGRTLDKRVDLREWHTTKTFYLASVYGCDWTKLLEIDPDMTEEQARMSTKMFKLKYQALVRFGKRVSLMLDRDGYVRDIFGRIRWFPGWFSTRHEDRDSALREAINMLIQGPAASITKIMMLRWEAVMAGLDGHLIMTVHDEIVAEVAECDVAEVLRRAPQLSQDIVDIEMPLEPQVGGNLGDIESPDD
jgi:uracil-DNA glycosylase family 4